MNATVSPQSKVQTAFSPAPWRLNKDDLTVQSINDDVVHVHAFQERSARDEANARLISAAPILYDLVAEAIDADDYGPEDWERWNNNARNAVDLATVPQAERLIPENGELKEVRPVVAFEVWVRLKKSSKYYAQGLNEDGKAAFFKLDGFVPQCAMGLMSDCHLIKFNSNSYRREDCEFYLVDPKNTKAFVRIA